MKTNENPIRKKGKNIYKTNQNKGISLIVLVITIIVIIILAAAVILTLTNNNPIDKANEARYTSDRANMQSVFTNTVAKVMAQNQSTLKVVPGKINSVTSGVSSSAGSVSYTLDSASNESSQSGTIEFSSLKDDTNTKYNTGKELPIYSAGETQWYVDEEGNITLKIGDKVYGEAEEDDINKDRKPPTDTAPVLTATTNSISVAFKQTDSDSGIDDSTKQYAIKKTSDTTWGEWVSNTSNNHSFTGLLMNTSYDIKTSAKDKLGNGPQESQVSTINTENVPNPVITVTPKNNIYGEVTVTITYPKINGGTYQYQDSDYGQIFTSQNEVTFKMKSNYNVYASVRIAGKVISSSTYSVTNILPLSAVATQDTQYFNKGKIAIIPKGFKISDKVAEQEIDTGLVVIAPDGSEFVWVPVSAATLNTLVDVTNMRSNLTEWSKNGALSGTPIAYSASGYREPDILADYDNNATNLNQMNSILGTNFVPNGTGNGSFKESMQKEYNDIYASIKKNGGFYVGRYETGDLSNAKVVSKKDNNNISNKTWYEMYAKQKKYASMLTGTNVKSNMIYGYQWDAIMKWFNSQYIVNSEKRGNFSGTIAATGSNPEYAEKNIYDMSGNVNERISEAIGTKNRSFRGLGYGGIIDNQFTALRNTVGGTTTPSDSVINHGSRMSLYL